MTTDVTVTGTTRASLAGLCVAAASPRGRHCPEADVRSQFVSGSVRKFYSGRVQSKLLIQVRQDRFDNTGFVRSGKAMSVAAKIRSLTGQYGVVNISAAADPTGAAPGPAAAATRHSPLQPGPLTSEDPHGPLGKSVTSAGVHRQAVCPQGQRRPGSGAGAGVGVSATQQPDTRSAAHDASASRRQPLGPALNPAPGWHIRNFPVH